MSRTVLGHSVRPLPLVAAFVALAAAIALSTGDSAPWWLIPLGVIGPDLSFLAGLREPAHEHRRGRMPRRVVPVYNLLHHPATPALVGGASLAAGSRAMLVLSIAWMSHIVWDRAVGYGLRDRNGDIIVPGRRLRRGRVWTHVRSECRNSV